MRRAFGSLGVYLVLVALAKSEPPAWVVNDDFEQWLWKPITPSMAQSGRDLLAQGKALPYEHRAMLFRLPAGFVLPAGRMVEGSEAYRGKSMLLVADGQHLTVGVHDRYANLLAPGKSYAYSVALKGRGKFGFRASMQGTDPYTGQSKSLGSPILISIAVSEKWEIYHGTFVVPQSPEERFKLPERISACIHIAPPDTIYMDDFQISATAAGPDGKVLRHDGQSEASIPLALNEPPGRYHVVVRELASGREARTTFMVR